MSYVGYGKNNVKLNIGDICTFTINKIKYEGMIMYDEDVFAYVFEMKDDKFSSVYMLKADLDSIEKIINIYSTNMNDDYGFYREIYNKNIKNYTLMTKEEMLKLKEDKLKEYENNIKKHLR